MPASVLFVGESPPAGSLPDFVPFDCASGTRLAGVLGLHGRAELLAHVPRGNVFDVPTGVVGTPAWNEPLAANRADRLAREAFDGGGTIVALGRRVAEAFGMPAPLGTASSSVRVPNGAWWHHRSARGTYVLYAPHPSGASSTLNDVAVRTALRQALLPELVAGCPTLRPWHFRLEDPAVLADLAVAVSPYYSAAGAAVLEWVHGQRCGLLARATEPLLARVRAAQSVGPDAVAFVAGQARRDAVGVQPWDEPLSRTVADLLSHDGVRTLGARWRPQPDDGKPPARRGPNVPGGWLVAAVRQRAVDYPPAPPHYARAVLGRYAARGLL